MTVALAVRTSPMSRTAPPLVRLLPAPVPEPPFDDDAGGHDQVRPDGTAGAPDASRSEFALEPPLDWLDGRHGRPATRPAESAPRSGVSGSLGGTRTGAAPLSEAKLAAHRYLARCVEILGGFRPMAHLRALTAPTIFDQIAAELTRPRPASAGTGAGSRQTCPAGARQLPAPPTNRPWPQRARLAPVPGGRVVLRHLRVCEPRAGVAEVAAVLGRGDQVWAMAIRLERQRGTWLCSQLQVL